MFRLIHTVVTQKCVVTYISVHFIWIQRPTISDEPSHLKHDELLISCYFSQTNPFCLRG